MRVFLITVMLVVAWCGTAQAESFNCEKAKAPFSQFVCESAVLSQINDTLSDRLTEVESNLTSEAVSLVNQGQREWRDYARLACSEDGRTFVEPYRDEIVECIVSHFSERMTVLNRSRDMSGYVFYSVDEYLVLPDPYEEGWNPVGTFVHSRMHLDGNGALGIAYNEYVDGGYGGGLQAAGVARTEYDGTYNQETADVIDSVTDRRISSSVDFYFYGHGAAHGNWGISYSHFLVQEMRPMQASDIFDDSEWAENLDGLVFALLKAQNDEGWMWEEVTSVIDAVSDVSRWSFMREGLQVQFQLYEIVPYAGGAPTVVVPWDELTGMMSEDGMNIAFGD